MLVQRLHTDPTGEAGSSAYQRLKPGPGKAAQEVRADQRTRICRAMVQLVGEVGYSNVTMRSLTRLAGVSAETFYAQFDGKEECLIDAYTSAAARLRERLQSARVETLDRPMQAERTVTRLVRDLAADPHAARLMLVEAHAGGPAALRQIRDSESKLEQALRATLDRRGDRVSSAIPRWLAAGIMHVVRARTLSGETVLSGTAGAMVRWGRSCVEGRAFSPSAHPVTVRDPASTPQPLRISAQSSDRDVVLVTVLRLARSGGYWRLSTRQIREAAGLSAARFKREFRSVDECYLAALRLLGRSYFERPPSANVDWPSRLHAGVSLLCDRVAADPDLARLLFVDVLTPGVPGLRTREELIAEQTDRCRDWIASASRPPHLALAASTAGLWGLICRELEAGRAFCIPETAPTFSFFLLTSAIGAEAAASVLEGER